MPQLEIEQRGTQRRIRDAVFACMADTDMDKIRVSDVIRFAHVSRSTFYRYFDDVPSVVLQFEDDLLANMRAINNIALKARFSTNQLDATPTMITRMEMLADHRDEIVALNGPHGDPGFVHKATVFMHDYLSQRLSEVLGPSDDLEFYLAFVLAGHNNLIQFWLEKRPEVSPRHVASTLNKLYYAPFFLTDDARRTLPHAPRLD